MAKRVRTTGIVYRRGQLKARDFTPRPEKDTVGRPGQEAGLSTFIAPMGGNRVQKIDLARLKPPLVAVEDDPTLGGTPGHVSIAPVDAAGQVDQQLLEDWAAARASDETHYLTELLLKAVVIPRGKEERE